MDSSGGPGSPVSPGRVSELRPAQYQFLDRVLLAEPPCHSHNDDTRVLVKKKRLRASKAIPTR
eukprot:9975-Eustigmatos_ZCMA.PRE.1